MKPKVSWNLKNKNKIKKLPRARFESAEYQVATIMSSSNQWKKHNHPDLCVYLRYVFWASTLKKKMWHLG